MEKQKAKQSPKEQREKEQRKKEQRSSFCSSVNQTNQFLLTACCTALARNMKKIIVFVQVL